MEYADGAAAFSLSNQSMLLTSCLKASLDVKINDNRITITSRF